MSGRFSEIFGVGNRGNYLLTRRQVADALGTSVATVRRLEKKRELNPVVDRDGVYRFDAQEVAALAAKRGRASQASGEVAAQVFGMFRELKKLDDIVIATRQTPATVRALYLEWTTPLGGRPINKEAAEEREQAAHEEMMREWDRDLKERRRGNG